MGVNELFYGGFMRLGSYSGLKGIILFALIVWSGFSSATQVISENKAERIVRDLLSSAYNRTHNLPAVIPDNELSSMQRIHKANLLRSIAKKAVRVSGVLYQKHPVTGLAITLGAGFVADELIDSAFQKFTSALQDEQGNFYVMAMDPMTGKEVKVYLEEEPSLFSPAYISLGNRKVVSYSSDYFKVCESSSFDEALHCSAQKELEKVLERLDSLGGQTVSEGKIVSYSPHPIYSDGRFVNYSYKRCFTSGECLVEKDLFTVRVYKTETSTKGKPYVVPYSSVVNENAVVLSDDTQIANFAKKAVSLDSQDFTSEERQVISNINPKDVRQRFVDPRLSAKDLAKFRYSESMFDNPVSNDGSSNGDIGNNSGGGGNGKGGNNSNDKPFALVDFSAPDVPLPDLDAPSSDTILSPLKKFLPDLQNFELRSRSAQCPVWKVDIEFLNFHSEISEHCVLVEKYRELLKLIFGIIWSFIALRHVLSA
ncbi:hypothetical protein ACWIYZ_11315 [Ursidibacter arcticus]